MVAAFGMDPLLSPARAAWGCPSATTSTSGWAACAAQPIEVIPGQVTGLPIPADAEIVIEGSSTRTETLTEGPFGEFTGYYASGDARRDRTCRSRRCYHRDDPIMLGSPPMRPPADDYQVRSRPCCSALIWDELEAAGVPDVRGVVSPAGRRLTACCDRPIKQRYAGHAKQAADRRAERVRRLPAAATWSWWTTTSTPTTPRGAVGAVHALGPRESTRLHPATAGARRSTRASRPTSAAAGDFTNSRLIIDATRPFHWRDKFPRRSSPAPSFRPSCARSGATSCSPKPALATPPPPLPPPAGEGRGGGAPRPSQHSALSTLRSSSQPGAGIAVL